MPRARIWWPRRSAAGRSAIFGLRAADTADGEENLAVASPAALAAASALGSSTRVLGVYEQRWSEITGPRCVYLHGVADPGNVGTVLRGAHAFGFGCVALGPGCADPHGPKAVRASMGAIFAIRLAHAADISALPGRKVALSAAAGENLSAAVANAAELTLLVGAERDGLPARGPRGLRALGANRDPRRLAQRRDGGDGRDVRGDARVI